MKIIYSLFTTYFGDYYINDKRHSTFDKKEKDIAIFNETENSIIILDKKYNNPNFIKWIKKRHKDAKVVCE